jgi:outer membrane protein assembly factor BamB
MKMNFSIENGELIVKEPPLDIIKWRGKLMDCSVESIVAHPQKEICFVLLSNKDGPKLYPGGPRKGFRNLICTDISGRILWITDLPTGGVDFYTKIIWSDDFSTGTMKIKLDIKENTLIALSYSGYLVNINPETGSIVWQVLIK